MKRKNILLYSELLELFMEEKKMMVKESSISTFSCLIRNHIAPLLGDMELKKISSTKLQHFMAEMIKKGKTDGKGSLSSKSIKDIMSIIKSSINYASRIGLIKKMDLNYICPSSKGKKRIETFTLDEQKIMFRHLYKDISYINIGIILSLTAGLRIGEVCGLKWSDIDLGAETITVNRTVQRIYLRSREFKGSKVIISEPKSSKSIRTIPLGKEISQFLKENENNMDTYLLTGKDKPVEPKSYRYYYYNMLKKLNIRKRPFHSLRHSFATRAVEIGTDYKTISEILGHSSVSITLGIYVHPRLEHKKKCIESFLEALKG